MTTLNGLPADAITAITFDATGCIWIGTTKGLTRWDGVKTYSYLHNPGDSTSISGNYISPNVLKYDGVNDRVLVGTERGLSILDIKTNQFTNYFNDEDNVQSLQGEVLAVFIDMNKGIWLGTSRGLTKFSECTKSFQNFLIPASLIDADDISLERLNAVFDIVQDQHKPHLFWMATLEGLVKFNSRNNSMLLFRVPGEQYVKRMNEMNELILHSNGNLYIGTWNYDLSIFNTAEEQFVAHLGPNANQASLRYQEVLTPLLEKSKHELWVSSLKGLGILNTETLQIKFVKTFTNNHGRRYDPKTLSITTEENFWIGSDFGLQFFKRQQKPIHNFFFEPRDELHMYLTNSLCESRASNRLYIGYKGGEGLHYFDLNSNRFHTIPYPKRSVRENNILKIVPGDQDGKIFFLTIDELYRFDENSNKATPLKLPYQDISENTDMFHLNKQQIWISGIYYGIRKYDLQLAGYTSDNDWKAFFKPHNDRPNIILMANDGKGRIWFSRYGKSYGYFLPGTTEVYYFDQPGKQFDVKSFYLSNDTLWVGTSNHGLGFVDPHYPQGGVVIKYNMGNGLTSNFIQSIERDRNGRFWLLTSTGLECITPSMKRSFHMDKHHGLRQKDIEGTKSAFFPGRLYQLADGRIIIGYRGGIGMFNPDSIGFTAQEIRPYLFEIRIFGNVFPMDSLIRAQKKIELKHKQNYISFDYSALNLDPSQSIRLYHRLEGIDLDWIASREQIAAYPKLAPGEYKFTIRLEQTSGYRRFAETAYTVTIASPWWNNPYAWAAYLLIAIGIVVSVYRFQLRRKLLIKEAENLKALDGVKTKLYTNITHEFRTPLTVILGMADRIKEKTGKALAHETHLINRNGKNLLQLVNQMLDLQKIEADAMPARMIQGDIIPYFAYVVHSFSTLAASRKINLSFEPKIPSQVMDYDPEMYQKILSNLLSNAIKFTPENGSILVEATLEQLVPKKSKARPLVLKISDTGIGIPETSLPYIFDRFYQVRDLSKSQASGTGIGLALTKELVKILGGEIRVSSQSGRGSSFTLIFPVSNTAPLQKQDIEQLYEPSADLPLIKTPQEHTANTYFTSQKPIALIVEDNQDMMEYLRMCLQEDFQLTLAFNGKTGVEKALEIVPDVIISDVMMPEMDGFDLCEKLKSDFRTSHIPVILLTAKVDTLSRLEGLERGADAYLTKPFHKEELSLRLKKMIELRKKLQERYASQLPPSPSENQVVRQEDEFMIKVHQLVETNLSDENFDINQLCRSLTMSRAQLYRKFEALTDIPIGKYIRKQRLNKAKELLQNTNANVTEAAMEAGFRNLSYFSTAFKEEFGITPKEV